MISKTPPESLNCHSTVPEEDAVNPSLEVSRCHPWRQDLHIATPGRLSDS
ncbi:hypothetical protein [Halorhodospira halochloris]|nr:hypothetical protein [Halorhodospira halochloris]